MIKYKVRVSIDEKEYFWVIIENGTVTNRYATRAELVKITTKGRFYNKTNTCSRCRKDNNITDKSILYPHNARKEYDKKGNWTGNWICFHCYTKLYKYGQYEKPVRYYNDSNTCDRCGINFDKAYSPFRHYKEYKDEKWTGKWICHKCYSIDDKKRLNHIGNLIKAINECTKKKYRYNITETCDRCGIKLTTDTYPRREFDEEGNWKGKWDCYKCYSKYDPNSKTNLFKSVGDRITGNQDPHSSNAKGDRGQKLLCIWKGYKDLNIENSHSHVDCIDEKTGLYYQVKMAYYVYGRWDQNFTNEHNAIHEGFVFEDLYLFCASKDGKMIEKILRLPSWEIIDRSEISVYDNKNYHWYNDYIIEDEEELKNVNEIWMTKL